ncbi:MAG: hypothetical protein JXJ20_01190 [Anaerolineae bacterium]|nr:hypothetical protein [Anaerolineae bacterium]
MRKFFSADFTFTKRTLGLLLMAGGLILALGMVAAEWVGQSGGFGTIQKMGVLLGVIAFVVGVTLLPLGDQPA